HALLLHFLGDVFVADGDRAVDKGQQFPLCNLRLHLLLELLHAHTELVLNEIFVGLLTDEVSSGKYHLSHLPLMQINPEFFIAHAQAHAASLLRDFLQADVLIANSCQYPALSDAAAKHVVEEAAAGDDGDDHHRADDEKNAAQHNFL